MTDGLLALRDWLCAHQVRVVGMESTGSYWKPVYYLLEDGLECWLLNARHLRNVPGRKTDVADAAWIAQLVEHGLVRPSFVPPRPIRELRDLTRYRKTVIEERTREAQRLEKLLEDAGIKLSCVATDILGVSGRAMLAALVAGVRDPMVLAKLAKVACASSSPSCGPRCGATSTAITACWPPRCSPRIDTADATIGRLSEEIDQVIAPYAWAMSLLETIAGVARRTAEVIVAETGADM
jgi:transposase